MPSARIAGRGARILVSQPRVLLAAKAAVAAGLAWWIAPHVPGVAADYPYYAPLGAVVSIYPTIAASLRQGLQTLAGLLLGIGLAAGVIAIDHTGVVTVALVVGVGVLLAGLPFLGSGRDWVPMVGLFVLLIGGADSQDYSLGYVIQMVVGIVVGLVITLVAMPPLHTTRARYRVRGLRLALADRVDDLQGVFEAEWPLDEGEWKTRIESLPATLARVRAEVELADDSRRLNPRRVATRPSRRLDVTLDRSHLEASESVAFHLGEAAEVAGRLSSTTVDGAVATRQLAGILGGVAAVLRTSGDEAGDESTAVDDAWRLVDDAWAAVDAAVLDDGRSVRETRDAISVIESATRILVALDPDRTGVSTGPPAPVTRRRGSQYG